MWRHRSWKLAGIIFCAEVDKAHIFVVRCGVMLTWEVRKVLVVGVTYQLKIIFCHLVTAVKILHLEHARALPLDAAIDSAYRGLIIADNGGYWLGVAQLFKTQTPDKPFTHVEKDSSQLCLHS